MHSLRQAGRTAGLFGLAVVFAAIVPSFADAAWLGFKNNTNAVVVIQAADLVMANGKVQQVRPGKPHVLYPGEVAWDAVAAPGPRLIVVFDPKANNRQVLREQVDCNKNDIFLSLQFVTPQQVKGQPPLPPQLKLVPAAPPTPPPGSTGSGR
jgi:hypothetical protein